MLQEQHKEALIERRMALVAQIEEKMPEHADGVVLIFSGFDQERVQFRPHSSFYYFTGIREPAFVYVADLKNKEFGVFVPDFGDERTKWVGSSVSQAQAKEYGLDFVKTMGQQQRGYTCSPYYPLQQYSSLIEYIREVRDEKRSIMGIVSTKEQKNVDQIFSFARLSSHIKGLEDEVVDVSHLVSSLRRKKSRSEIEKMYSAIQITTNAHMIIARDIKPGMKESELQALISYLFSFNQVSAAFQSIVATGKQSTILHYQQSSEVLKEDDLVVIDIGAEYDMYCADISRTYPISGKFTKQQRLFYDVVVEAQEYIAAEAKPGMWLCNVHEPEASLQHLAIEFFKKHDVHAHFWHGIGHFLGLDVHDVSTPEPLQDGDVITIEPGLYVPEKNIGIRVEDDYWITERGALSLSDALEKSPAYIEKMMAGSSSEG